MILRVLIVVFGDHLPAGVYLPALPRDTGSDRNRMFRVPYFLWSNFSRESAKMPDLISSNFLAPLILREAGMALPSRWRLLERLRGKVPVFSLMKKTNRGDWSETLAGVDMPFAGELPEVETQWVDAVAEGFSPLSDSLATTLDLIRRSVTPEPDEPIRS